MVDEYKAKGVEPPLSEVMAEPIIQMLMKSDGITMGTLLPLIEEASDKVQKQDAA